MLTEICAEIRNYFPVEKRHGRFEVSGGSIAPLDFLQDGQYFRIVGSVFNDGVYQYPTAALTDEVFRGEIWAMAVPPVLVSIAAEIKGYVEQEGASPSPYTSENFDGYSYTRATDSDGAVMGWQQVFGKRLNRWRRISE